MASNERNENMGFGEQLLRGAVGLVIMETVIMAASLTPAMMAVLSLLSIYVMFTAATGWDPVYAAIRSLRSAEPSPLASISAFPAPAETAAARAHKKVA